jgi:hypothetical protein
LAEAEAEGFFVFRTRFYRFEVRASGMAEVGWEVGQEFRIKLFNRPGVWTRFNMEKKQKL